MLSVYMYSEQTEKGGGLVKQGNCLHYNWYKRLFPYQSLKKNKPFYRKLYNANWFSCVI